jgi:alpha-glucosidase
VINLGLSGQPYSGPDIGGFSGDPPAELYLRWFQLAAFLPFFRTHSATGTARREPWVFGEPYTSILRAFSRLRCQLMPYIYTLAWEASQTGAPLVRPLFWSHPEIPALWDRGDAFLLGDRLLVAPVLDPGKASRELDLPPGGWYSFWDHRYFTGLEKVDLPTPLERIPLLVKSGSLIPMEQNGRLILQVYAPQPGSSPLPEPDTSVLDLYSDPGDGPASDEAPWRLDRFTLQSGPSELTLDWQMADGSPNGAYPFPYLGVELRLFGFTAERFWLDGKQMPWRGEALSMPAFESLRWRR